MIRVLRAVGFAVLVFYFWAALEVDWVSVMRERMSR